MAKGNVLCVAGAGWPIIVTKTVTLQLLTLMEHIQEACTAMAMIITEKKGFRRTSDPLGETFFMHH